MRTRKKSQKAGGGPAVPPLQEAAGSGSLAAFRAGWAVFMVLATGLPQVWYWLATPPGFAYTWILPPYPVDSFAYLAWAQQAAQGQLLFQLKYTAMPHAPFLFQPFFLVCGWLTALCSGQAGVVLWLAKAAGVVLFLLVLYRYLDSLNLNPAESITATVLVGISSGAGGLLGWLASEDLVKTLRPVDTWLPDANTYWALQWNPLFPYSLALLLLVVYWLDRGTREGRTALLWRSGLASGIMVLVHPYAQPLLAVLVAVFVLVRQRGRAFAYLWRYGVALLPFFLWVAVTAARNPIVDLHNAMGEMKSSSPLSYVIGLGLPLVLAAVGAAVLRGRMLGRCWQLAAWVCLALALSYVPVWFQRKFIFGSHIPLCILAAIAFDGLVATWCSPAWRRRAMAASAVVLLPLLVATQLYNLGVADRAIAANKGSAYYISRDTLQGLQFLKSASNPADIVFASLATSAFIPSYSGNTTVWGHWAMSVDYKQRQKWYADITSKTSNMPDEKKRREFWNAGITYIFADGDLYRALKKPGGPWSAILAEAEKIYENDSVLIFKRRRGSM